MTRRWSSEMAGVGIDCLCTFLLAIEMLNVTITLSFDACCVSARLPQHDKKAGVAKQHRHKELEQRQKTYRFDATFRRRLTTTILVSRKSTFFIKNMWSSVRFHHNSLLFFLFSHRLQSNKLSRTVFCFRVWFKMFNSDRKRVNLEWWVWFILKVMVRTVYSGHYKKCIYLWYCLHIHTHTYRLL